MDLKFRAFRAVNDLETCIKFVDEHRNVLKDYGITNITTNNEVWMYDPNIYCIVAESFNNNSIVGGVRIQVSEAATRLPVELAIGRMDEDIYTLVANSRNNGGIAELCALWNAKAVAGMGISMLLIRAGVAAASQLCVNSLISICADYTLQMFQKAGFHINNSMGMSGCFPYPNASYTARVLGIVNTAALENAAAADKARIESLRKDPTQAFTEQGARGEIKINYNLVF